MTSPDQETLNALVARFFRTDDVTLGHDPKEFIYRYRGQLLGPDSALAYDQLAEGLRPYQLMPLFRKEENGGHLILIVPLPEKPEHPNPQTNIILFALTVLTVLMAGVTVPASVNPDDSLGLYVYMLTHLASGLPFAVSLLAILLAHEFGHYFATRFHKMVASLPYFIPMPIPPVGTLGAVIQMKEPPKNKRILLDIGIAGPLAGLVVAIPVLLYGLSISPVGLIPNTPGNFIEGNSILYLAAKFAVFGKLLPAPASYGALPPVLYWLQYFFTGTPFPTGGSDVLLSPIAWAGWVGLLVTSLNLIPAGQLDGGHMIYVLLGGKRLRALLPIIQVTLAVLGFFSVSWWLWLAILSFFGRFTDEPLDQITELGPGRRLLAVFGILVFLLVFMPVPIPVSILQLFP